MNLITKIQKYSLHDGCGIRTTIFFKGCSLKCSWCHNPETQNFQKQLLLHYDRCLACGQCTVHCPNRAISMNHGKMQTNFQFCNACGSCTDFCFSNVREIVGKEYTVDALVREIQKDEIFYEESGGGVTLSGGEVMLSDISYLEALCKKLKRLGISVFIDTCGYAPYENFERLMPYTDTFLYDIKIIDPHLHKKYTGADNSLILSNLEKLYAAGAKIWIRIPVIKGVNADALSMKAIIDYLLTQEIQPLQIHLLPYHNTGSVKYEKLGMNYEGKEFARPTEEETENLASLFRNAGFSNVKIGG